MSDPQQIPTSERLAQALEAADADPAMIRLAREGFYDDYKSPLAFPITQLVHDLRQAGLTILANRAADGDFDATKAEADAWPSAT